MALVTREQVQTGSCCYGDARLYSTTCMLQHHLHGTAILVGAVLLHSMQVVLYSSTAPTSTAGLALGCAQLITIQVHTNKVHSCLQ
jgi:hypothetical protein